MNWNEGISLIFFFNIEQFNAMIYTTIRDNTFSVAEFVKFWLCGEHNLFSLGTTGKKRESSTFHLKLKTMPLFVQYKA